MVYRKIEIMCTEIGDLIMGDIFIGKDIHHRAGV